MRHKGILPFSYKSCVLLLSETHTRFGQFGVSQACLEPHKMRIYVTEIRHPSPHYTERQQGFEFTPD